MRAGGQLHRLSRHDFALPNYVDFSSRLVTKPANDLPMLRWPNGRWCSDANRYLRELFDRNLSRRNAGGSIAVAARQITQLMRFCFSEGLDFLDLNDNKFSMFIGKLLIEKSRLHPDRKARKASTVVDIGRTCLNLLESVARHHCDEGLIGPSGRIVAEKKSFESAPRSGRQRGKTITYWDHSSLPERDAETKRFPIETNAVEKIRDAIASLPSSSHDRMRRHVMLRFFEITGARRGEVALIQVSDVRKAGMMEHPMLKVPTLKKGGNAERHRQLPVSRADILFLLQYCNIHRSSIIRRKLKGQDTGFVLVSGRTGRALKPGSISQEMGDLAKAAGILESACAHMFRHRFITKLLVALIERYNAQNKDEFRRMLLEVESLKREVLEWTDQASTEALDRYVNLAYDEIGNLKAVKSAVFTRMKVESFIGILQVELDELKKGASPILTVERLLTYARGLRGELLEAEEASPSSQERSEETVGKSEV